MEVTGTSNAHQRARQLRRTVRFAAFGGKREVYGFRGLVMGKL